MSKFQKAIDSLPNEIAALDKLTDHKDAALKMSKVPKRDDFDKILKAFLKAAEKAEAYLRKQSGPSSAAASADGKKEKIEAAVKDKKEKTDASISKKANK